MTEQPLHIGARVKVVRDADNTHVRSEAPMVVTLGMAKRLKSRISKLHQFAGPDLIAEHQVMRAIDDWMKLENAKSKR